MAAVDAMRQGILDQLELKPGMHVADIGMGQGWFLFSIARSIGSSGKVYGTDIDANRVRFVQGRAPTLGSEGAKIDARLCKGERDTALDDVPAGSLDLILMIDSLCFNHTRERKEDVAYLSRFSRLLKASGRLIHHMDCRCQTSESELSKLFAEAGFAPRIKKLELPAKATDMPRDSRCGTDEARARHAFVGVFEKAR